MGLVFTPKEAAALGIKIADSDKKRKNKYNSQKVVVDGIKFDSQAEANYYCMLKILLRKGEIDGFCRQARFIITEGKNGEKGSEYVCDFVVFYQNKTYRIVDVKGVKTPVFKLKIKSLREKYPKLTVELEE